MISNDFEKYLTFEDSFFYDKDLKNKRVCFLDRDGIIIKDKHYIQDESQVELEIGVSSFMNKLVENNIPAVVVTNQSGISRGILSWREYDSITKKMIKLIGEPNPLIGIFANSHIKCEEKNWRKPNPNMLLFAAKFFNINLKNSTMIGDRLSDLIAGARANVNTLIHLKTGKGIHERRSIESYKEKDMFIYNNNKSKLLLFNNLEEISNLSLDIFSKN